MQTLSPNTLQRLALAALPVALLMATACSSLPKGESSKQVIIKEGVPGAYSIETFKTTATVTGIDAASRKITVVSKDGKKQVFKAGPDVINFDQIRVGDQLVVTVAEELVVYMAKDAQPTPEGSAALVALAPKGAKPGVVMAGTTQITAKVIGLDRRTRKALLQLPDGTTRSFTVRPDVDLSTRELGEEVVFRCTEAVAISVEKP